MEISFLIKKLKVSKPCEPIKRRKKAAKKNIFLNERKKRKLKNKEGKLSNRKTQA
jgi:hypothetical protein